MGGARFGLIAFCIFLTISGCRARAPNWDGTWSLNPSKSSFQGLMMTISISGNNEYHYDDGVVSISFRCDGKLRSIGNNRAQKCVQTSPTALDQTLMKNGVKASTIRWELSAGGKVFTSTATLFGSDGAVVRHQLVASRISGSNSFVGQWQDRSVFQNYSGRILRLDNQYLHIGSPNSGKFVDVPLDGTPATMYGDSGLAERTYRVHRIGPGGLEIVGTLNGHAVSEESLKLNNDGSVIIGSWWNPSRPTDKATLYYEKLAAAP